MTKPDETKELCGLCGGRLRETTITDQKVPAQACERCGENWIEEDTFLKSQIVVSNFPR